MDGPEPPWGMPIVRQGGPIFFLEKASTESLIPAIFPEMWIFHQFIGKNGIFL
jgi:hypothetical protein